MFEPTEALYHDQSKNGLRIKTNVRDVAQYLIYLNAECEVSVESFDGLGQRFKQLWFSFGTAWRPIMVFRESLD